MNTSVQKLQAEIVGRASGGRPRDPGKDKAILEAARDTFFERGFNRTAMEEVAARAGVSKVTLYKRFADKEALFEAVVRREVEKMVEEFENWPYDDGSLPERLNAFGSILLRFLFSTRHHLLDRMLSQEFATKPDMARRFYEAGPGSCRSRLGTMLADSADHGEITVDDPLMAAADLVSLWMGSLQKELDFRIIETPIPDPMIDERVRRGTRLFLKTVDWQSPS
ncbi:TetR/AcrR family transcriptional regulator [Sphingomonas sp.]|uniref:TetR/AcrR family transcriptional regulator n=1 Tax=Sphingomonas sp. TaxID=28214 RepID=UPI00286C47B9|nr:TetR/AcrR family transcriptional regulator [Sphingomonas sp.]